MPHSPLVFPSWCAIACHSQNFQPFAFIPKRQKRVLILADEWSLTACPCLAAGAAVRRIRAVRTHPRRHCPCRERPGPSIFQDRHGLFFKIEVFFVSLQKIFSMPTISPHGRAFLWSHCCLGEGYILWQIVAKAVSAQNCIPANFRVIFFQSRVVHRSIN